MARKDGDRYQPWRAGGVTLGHIRSGIYWIDRTVRGRRFRVSTGCRTPEAALGEYARFEADPARYVPRGKVGTAWDQAAVEFLRFSESVKHNSTRHVEKQEAHLANLGAFTRGGGRVFASLDAFTTSDIRTFIAALSEGTITGHEVGPPSVNRYLATIKAFMSWARSEKLTTNAADTEVHMVREDKGKNLPEEIEEPRWRVILQELDERWRCAGEVQLGAGLRYSEVAGLAAEHVHDYAIHLPVTKGRKGRTVPASARTIAAARRLLELGGVPNDEASQFDHRLEVAARHAQVTPCTSHAFRHTYGTVTLRSLLAAGQGLRELQERMGHARITTTEKYLHAVRARDGGQKVVVGAPL